MPQAREVVDGRVRLRGTLAPWERSTRTSTSPSRGGRRPAFSSASYHRLRRIMIVDPTDLIRSNHPIPPAH
jgi:hypothetical protein